MSRLSVPNLESDAGPSGQIYAQIKKAIGSVPNTFAAIAAHGPAALKAVLAADAVLASGSADQARSGDHQARHQRRRRLRLLRRRPQPSRQARRPEARRC